jgi:hypothetical protein
MQDLTNQRIGKRLVLGFAKRDPFGRRHWKVQCECGRIGECRTSHIHLSCPGCARKGRISEKRTRPFEACYNAWTKRARKRHLVDLTYEQYVALTAIKHCHYCGTEVRWTEYLNKTAQGRRHGSNLDRKDSSLGYTLPNVVVCCWRCNAGKNNHFTYDEWVRLGAVIRSWKVSSDPGR